MANLWKAIKNTWREKKDQAAEKMSDPIRDGKFAIEDSKKKLEEIQSSITDFSKNIKINEVKLKEEQAAVRKWQSLATKAAEKQNEDDVRKCIQDKKLAQAKVDNLKKIIEINQAHLAKAKSDYQKTNAIVSEAESNHSQLAVRKQMADAQKELKKARAGFDSDSCFADLGKLKEAVIADECEVEALEETVGADSLSSMEDKYGATGDGAVDDEVAALMAKANGKK